MNEVFHVLIVTTSGAVPYMQQNSSASAEAFAADVADKIETGLPPMADWLRDRFAKHNLPPPRVVIGVQVLAPDGSFIFFETKRNTSDSIRTNEQRRSKRGSMEPTQRNNRVDRIGERGNDNDGDHVANSRRDVLQKLQANGEVFNPRRIAERTKSRNRSSRGE
jgi:hypothetical protein